MVSGVHWKNYMYIYTLTSLAPRHFPARLFSETRAICYGEAKVCHYGRRSDSHHHMVTTFSQKRACPQRPGHTSFFPRAPFWLTVLKKDRSWVHLAKVCGGRASWERDCNPASM